MNTHSQNTEHATPVLLPCTRAEDLYAPNTRHTIARLIGDWLYRHKLTVTEFLHSAAALQKFEAAGTTYQHAIQRMAVTLAGKTKAPVVQIVRALDALTTSAIQRVYSDEREAVFPDLSLKEMVELAATCDADPRGIYVLNGAVAKYLAACTTWDEKLLRLLRLHAHAAEVENALPVRRVAESLVTEIMADRNVFVELLGADAPFGEQIFRAIHLFKGSQVETDGLAPSLEILARHFRRDTFCDARAAVASHILSECRCAKRLRPHSQGEELSAFQKLSRELKAIEGRYVDPQDLAAALSQRSKRLVTPEALAQLLEGANTPDVKLDRLLAVEAKVEGAANKRALVPFAISILSTRDFEEELAPEYVGMVRLKRLADLQRRVADSGFPDAERDKMAGMLDAAAARLESRCRFFTNLDGRLADPAERASAYLRLFTGGAFTEGRLASKARRSLLAALACPEFASSYTTGKPGDRKTLLMALVEELKKVGISPEESIRAMMAS